MDILQIKGELSGWQGGPGFNTFNFVNGVDPLPWSESQANVAADGIHSLYTTLKPYLHTDVTARIPLEATLYDSETGTPIGIMALTGRANVVGSDSGPDMPRFTMLVSKLRTDKIVGRHILTGRHFLGPVGAATIGTAGEIVSAARTAVSTAYAGMLDVGGPRLIVWHRPVNRSGGDWGHVQTATAKALPGVLRSRRD